jgi:hypothetical protein
VPHLRRSSMRVRLPHASFSLAPVLSVVLALSASTLLAGCAQTYYTRPGTFKPAMANVAPAERLSVWQHAVSGLLDQGYVPQVLNEGAGYISAKRREDLNDDALTGTMATVVISPEGAVRVELSGIGVFSSEQAFFNAVGQRQAQIMQAIMGASVPAR